MDFAQKADKVRGMSVVVKKFIIQSNATCPRRSSYGSHSGNPRVTAPYLLDGSVSFRSPYPTPQRLQQKAAFIEKNNASFAFEALFLSAANLRGSSERSRLHSALALVATASADSNQDCEVNGAQNVDDTQRKTSARSYPGQAVQSNHKVRNPNTVFRVIRLLPIWSVVVSSTSVLVRDGVSLTTRSRFATHVSIGTPKRCYSPLSQPLLSMSFPARTSGPRFFDGLRALRDFLMVSYLYRSKFIFCFH
jgi:hypothetical protein